MCKETDWNFDINLCGDWSQEVMKLIFNMEIPYIVISEPDALPVLDTSCDVSA